MFYNNYPRAHNPLTYAQSCAFPKLMADNRLSSMGLYIILTFLQYRIPQLQMKSFQDWLDCQLYNSHLKNLTKIKQQAIMMKTLTCNRRLLKTANNSRNNNSINTQPYSDDKTPLVHHQQSFQNCSKISSKKVAPYTRLLSGDVHYLVNRDSNGNGNNESKLKNSNPKIRVKLLMKQNQIMQQNYNLASRLINVSSVISKSKQIQSYQKYQSLFKRNGNGKKFQNLRAKKLQKFMKLNQQNYIVGVHKAILKIKFVTLPKISEIHQPTIWFEVYSGTQKLISQHYSTRTILQNEIKMPFKKRPSKNIMMHIHCSRGLEYLNLGQYYIQMHKKNVAQQFEQLASHSDSRKHIHLIAQIQDIGLDNQKHKSLHIR